MLIYIEQYNYNSSFRLSGHASKKLVDGNPNFTDLSDKYRPTKIAEYFHSVYDDEWTNAFESLLQKGHIPEEEVIYTLFQLVWVYVK